MQLALKAGVVDVLPRIQQSLGHGNRIVWPTPVRTSLARRVRQGSEPGTILHHHSDGWKCHDRRRLRSSSLVAFPGLRRYLTAADSRRRRWTTSEEKQGSLSSSTAATTDFDPAKAVWHSGMPRPRHLLSGTLSLAGFSQPLVPPLRQARSLVLTAPNCAAPWDPIAAAFAHLSI
jgi:hypothetical protein